MQVRAGVSRGHIELWGSALVLVTLSVWRILFVGINAVVEEISKYFEEHLSMGYLNLGYLDDFREPGHVLNGASVLGPLKSLREAAVGTKPDRIVVGMTERRGRLSSSSRAKWDRGGAVWSCSRSTPLC